MILYIMYFVFVIRINFFKKAIHYSTFLILNSLLDFLFLIHSALGRIDPYTLFLREK